MLTFQLVGNILEVTETTFTFTSTSKNVTEYNINTWESRTNKDPFVPMTESSINWVKKHYLPKVGIYK